MLRFFWDVLWAREKQHVKLQKYLQFFRYYVLYKPIQGAILSIELKREKHKKPVFGMVKLFAFHCWKHTNT